MRNRCHAPSNRSYPVYGGRGIKVCERWQKFENFLTDMGEIPDEMSVERVDIDGDYCKENCILIPREHQNRNRRNSQWITFRGETRCLSEWAHNLGMKPKTLRARISDYGWSVEKALTTPISESVTGRELAESPQAESVSG